MVNEGHPVPTTTYRLARAKVSDGKSVKVTVPENTTIEAGKFYLIDGFLGVAGVNVVTGAGETEELVLTIEAAEYETDQIDEGDAFEAGDKVYWDNGSSRFTTDPAGNLFAGTVTVGKDTNDVVWFVFVALQPVLKQAVHQTDAGAAVGEGLPATLLTGEASSDNAVLWVANEVGPDGNDITVTLSDTGSEGEATVSVADETDITVVVEAGVTLAGDVIDAVNEHAEAKELVTALGGDGSDGSGAVLAVTETSLAGGTNMVGIPAVSEVNAIKDVLNGLLAKLRAANLLAAGE